MSLWVYLEGASREVDCLCPTCGHIHTYSEKEELFAANITHNLSKMANEAGVYGVVWRPEENGITKATQLIEPLAQAFMVMTEDPARFQQYNAANGWGLYEHFVPWLGKYLAACKEHPDADVRASG
jgi:hypothetical protein